MIKSWNIIVNDDIRLLKMMSDSLSIYDQALYYQRQSYFDSRKIGKIKTYSYDDLWDVVKGEQKIKDSSLDINIKQYIVKQVIKNWKAYIKAKMEYKKNPSKFLGEPKMPKYLYKNKKYNLVQVDKSRFRKIDELNNSICLPCSNYRVFVPKQIKLDDIRQITLQKYYNKIKINIIYDDKETIRNEYDLNSCIGVDLGVNNLCAITSNDKPFSYVINGRPLKSINHLYNKKLAEYKSQLDKCNNKQRTSKRIQQITMKRMNQINHYLHCASKRLVEMCVEKGVGTIIIGHNNEWKQECNMGKKNNQNFVQIPFNTLINQITYKASKYTDLRVVIVEESYTSKIDHMAFEEMKHQKKYLGKRVERGLFKSSTGKILNADINGAIGILRKGNVITEVQLMNLMNRGDVVSPKVFNLNL